MVERGAKHLVFMSRSGADSPSAAALVAGLEQFGIEATILRCDVTSKVDVEAAVNGLDRRYPIRGVLNAAMVLDVRRIILIMIRLAHQIFRTEYSRT